MTNTSNKPWQFIALGLALLAMLAAGLAIGLYVQLQSTTERVVEVVVTATPDAANQAVAQAESSLPAPQAQGETSVAPADETTAQTTANNETAPTPTIMDFLLSDARHFEGDPDAPVTMIEFSDFK